MSPYIRTARRTTLPTTIPAMAPPPSPELDELGLELGSGPVLASGVSEANAMNLPNWVDVLLNVFMRGEREKGVIRESWMTVFPRSKAHGGGAG